MLILTNNALEIENKQEVALIADDTVVIFGVNQAKETPRGSTV